MKKILVIEDNNDVRENLVEILELSNYEVVEASNGKLGVEIAQQSKPDLILCDVMMPELDGFGVLRILSKKADVADIPFIFLTAKAEKSDFRKGMNLGADDYITKPFDDVELLDAIEIRLKKSDRIRNSFDGTANGLGNFISEARGQDALNKLSEMGEVHHFKKKAMVYEEGQNPLRLFFIEEGKVKTFKTNDFGKEYITGVYNAGEFFGYQSLMQNEKYNDSAAVIEDTTIYFIPQEDFTQLLYNNRDFSARFIKMLANNVSEQEDKLLSLAYNSIRKRVAEALVELHEKFRESGNEKITILREDLANMVGTAKESVIRTLTDFKSEAFIEIEQGVIMVTDLEGLKNLPS